MMLLISVLILTSCTKTEEGQEATDDEPEPITVAVSILPQKTFVEHIAGDLVDTVVMVPPGQSPSSYEPTASQLMELSNAEVYFTIGVPFEQAFIPIIKKNLPDLPLVATDSSTQKRTFTVSHTQEEEEAGSIDPHIWMSPVSVIAQAQIMTEKLSELDPQHADIYTAGMQAFEKELLDLDAELTAALAPLKGSTLLVYHPAFGYFADRYGLVQKAVEVGGKEPTPKQIEALIRMAREDGISIIFVQPEFSKKSAKVIADAIGGKVITIAALDENYIENLRHIAQVLQENQ